MSGSPPGGPPPLPAAKAARSAAPLHCVPCGKAVDAPAVPCRACGRAAPGDASFCPGCGGREFHAAPLCPACAAPLVAEYFPPRRAAFRSLLFGPGFSQFYTKRYLRGTIYLATFLYSLLSLIRWAAGLYSKYMPQILAGDMEAYRTLVRALERGNPDSLGQAMLIIWILSIVDGYVTARALNARALLDARDRLAAEGR